MTALLVWLAVRLALPGYQQLLTDGGLVCANFQGNTITVATGLFPALVAALGTAALGSLGYAAGHVTALAILAAALIGLLDDAAGSRRATGLRGHFAQLLEGRLSTGVLKALIIPVTALVAAASLGRGLWAVLDALVVALTANMVNLLDVRPGRAVKGSLLLLAVAALPGLAMGWADMWLLFVGSLLAYAPADLRGRAMLGDSGANAFGFAAGWFFVMNWEITGRLVLLLILLGLHLLTERRSLTQLIDGNPLLRRLDRWGVHVPQHEPEDSLR